MTRLRALPVSLLALALLTACPPQEPGNDDDDDASEDLTYRDCSRTVELDSPIGQGLDSVFEHFYDARGFLTTIETDFDVDGVLDMIVVRQYFDDGRTEAIQFDDQADGSFDRFGTYGWAEDGRQLDFVEMNVDGDVLARVTFDHDAQGRIVRSDVDQGDDGQLDEIRHLEYDGEGDMVREGFDLDANGSVDNLWLHLFEDHRLQHRDYDDGADGDVDGTMDVLYNRAGYVSLETFDDDLDGVADRSTEYSDCE